MKVTELLNEAGTGGYNKPQARVNAKKTDAGEKTGTLRGNIGDWLEALNKQMKQPITKDHVMQVRDVIKGSNEYKKMQAIGFSDVSSAAAIKNGTFIFTDGKQTYNFLVNGKINNRSGYGGGERASTLPRIVPNDPLATLQKTMTRSLAHFASKKPTEKELSPRAQGIRDTVKPIPKK